MDNIDNPFVLREMREVQAAAGTLALEAVTSEIRRPQDIVPAFEALKDRAEAVYLASEGPVDANRFRINILALGARLPTTWSQQESVEAGGLMSCGPSLIDAAFATLVIRPCRRTTGGFSEPPAFFGAPVAFTDVFAEVLEHGRPPSPFAGGSARRQSRR